MVYKSVESENGFNSCGRTYFHDCNNEHFKLSVYHEVFITIFQHMNVYQYLSFLFVKLMC
jgi:hypothetical protein